MNQMARPPEQIRIAIRRARLMAISKHKIIRDLVSLPFD